MADSIYLDTFGLLALLNRDDQYHADAARVFAAMGNRGHRVLTTNLVLAEVGNGLARTTLRGDVGWLVGE